MERERAEVIFCTLTYGQKICLANALTNVQPEIIKRATEWGQLSASEQDALLKLDWEIMLGLRFPSSQNTQTGE